MKNQFDQIVTRDMASRFIRNNQKCLFKARNGNVCFLEDNYWQLCKNTKVAIWQIRDNLNSDQLDGFLKTLLYYAQKKSAAHTNNVFTAFLYMLRETSARTLTCEVLINHKSKLNKDTEWRLGVVKGFIKKWYQLGYSGVSESIIELLNSWKLKGNVKGDVVKRRDPLQGPLTDVELQGFNHGILQAYEKGQISLTELATGLIVSHTGRRPIQISHLKVRDILQSKNFKGEDMFLINFPRAKERNGRFRKSFKQFAITKELWVILNAQASLVKNTIKKILNFELNDSDLLELPLFPDWHAQYVPFNYSEFMSFLHSDRLHIPSSHVTQLLKYIATISNVKSVRTGKLLNLNARRFRYTTGTRAAREGFGRMVIAELLDHADNQNAHVYIENIPEHVQKIDQAVGHQIAIYAQAFLGVLVNNERDAKRGDDYTSRIKANGDGVGTCGTHGFCGANVPIPCYTCQHFQPWLNGPHQQVYDQLINDRERLINLNGDMQIASVNDRTILAVAQVIQICEKRRRVLANG